MNAGEVPAVVTLHVGTVRSTQMGWGADMSMVVCLGPICVLSVTMADDTLFCCSAGYSGQDFDWADYQKQCGAEAAPHLCFRNVSSIFAFALLLSDLIACTENLQAFGSFPQTSKSLF